MNNNKQFQIFIFLFLILEDSFLQLFFLQMNVKNI